MLLIALSIAGLLLSFGVLGLLKPRIPVPWRWTWQGVVLHAILWFAGHTLLVALLGRPWFALAIGLASLWTPVLRGLVQGRQHFAALGWALQLSADSSEAPVDMLVPAPFETAVEHLLEAGARCRATAQWMTRQQLLGADRCVLPGPTLLRPGLLGRKLPLHQGRGLDLGPGEHGTEEDGDGDGGERAGFHVGFRC